MILTIESIASKDILELVSYQQTAPDYTRITILRGHSFYARCVNGLLQKWTSVDTAENVKRQYSEAIQFEKKLGSSQE